MSRVREVAKALIRIGDHPDAVLLSRKNSPRKLEKHDRLELPGGGLDPGEEPLQALVRELGEEEPTGTLARAASRAAAPHVVLVSGENHYIYELTIDADVIAHLRPDMRESSGFEQVPRVELHEPSADRFTPKTLAICKAMRDQRIPWLS